MDVEMTLPLSQRPIPDGALGDDERTETERSPLEEGKGMALSLPLRTPGEGEAQQEDQDMEDEGDSPDGDSNGRGQGKKHHHRRGKQKGGKRHRNWKPYAKLTWEERQKLDERETRRACKRREQRFASGHPLAPYNTTQFLMDQHPPGGDNEGGVQGNQNLQGGDQGSNSALDSYGSCSESYDSPNDEDIFLEKDFSEAYETFHAERLQDMSKEELIKELLDLEAKVDRLERRSSKGEQQGSPPKHNINNNDTSSDDVKTNDGSPSKLQMTDSDQSGGLNSLELLIKRLKEENERLKRENVELQKKSVSGRTTEEG